jgi:hypothetical protein
MKTPAGSHSAEPDLVTIRTFASESEANIARGALEAFGIDCIVKSDDFGGQQESLTMANGISLVIRSADVSRAEDVLANVAENPS